MFPTRLEISHVRGIDRLDIPVHALTTLIGPNNAGKSTVLDAIRLFYGDLEWDDERDRPWHDGTANDPSVTISFDLNEDDLNYVRGHADDDTLRLRRQFTHSSYGRPGEILAVGRGVELDSDSAGLAADPAVQDLARWPGAPPGTCVYIPALADTARLARIAESEALREVLRRALRDDAAQQAIQQVTAGLARLRATLAYDNGPVAHLERRLSEALEPWGLRAAIAVADLTTDLVVDHLLRLEVMTGGRHSPISSQGTGVQRMALAALIQAVADLDEREPAGDFTWMLFEEPETHLHPAQVRRLGAALGRSTGSAVMITTHDMTMLAGQTDQHRLDTIVRLHDGTVAAPSTHDVDSAMTEIRRRSNYTEQAKAPGQRRHPPAGRAEVERQLLRELDSRRTAALFADRVIVVEGFSDCVFFEWLDHRGLLERLGPNVAFLDANGKYELHRAITVLSLFGVPHVVVWDEDAATVPAQETGKRARKARQDQMAWRAICAAANDEHSHVTHSPYRAPCRFTAGGVRFSGTIESWLEIPGEETNSWKAANLSAALDVAYTDPKSGLRARVDTLVAVLAAMFDGEPLAEHRTRPALADCLIAPPFPPPTVDFDARPAE